MLLKVTVKNTIHTGYKIYTSNFQNLPSTFSVYLDQTRAVLREGNKGLLPWTADYERVVILFIYLMLLYYITLLLYMYHEIFFCYTRTVNS